MSLTRVGLKCNGSVSDNGQNLYFSDITGSYNASTNPLGYGLPGGISSSNVATSSISIYYNDLDATATFNFTISAGTITVASLTDTAGNVKNILSKLGSTSWPFTTSNYLNINDSNYKATFPTIQDGLMTLTYVIGGVANGETFSYTTSTQFFRVNDLCCCLKTKRLTADPNCGCGESVIEQCNRVQFWLDAAICAANTNSTTDAKNYFTKAQDICDEDCGCGG